MRMVMVAAWEEWAEGWGSRIGWYSNGMKRMDRKIRPFLLLALSLQTGGSGLCIIKTV